jgi:hypothetical protein
MFVQIERLFGATLERRRLPHSAALAQLGAMQAR